MCAVMIYINLQLSRLPLYRNVADKQHLAWGVCSRVRERESVCILLYVQIGPKNVLEVNIMTLCSGGRAPGKFWVTCALVCLCKNM
jgi:hypothetical protein